MLMGIMSDSHGNKKAVTKAVEKAGAVSLWLHAGDYVEDADYLEKISELPVVKVAGNGDWHNTTAREDECITVENKKIWLTHGHKYRLQWGIGYLSSLAEKIHADIVVFGHTHSYLNKSHNNIYFLNPGSIALPRDGNEGTFAVLEVDEKKNLFLVNRHVI